MATRFLISRLSSLGDVVCSLPAAAALKAGIPDAHVVWAVDPRFAGIVDCCRAVDEVVRVAPRFKPGTWPRIRGDFEAALDLQGLLKSAIPVARCRARTKVGYHWQREGAWMVTKPVLPDPSSHHIVDQYVDVARAVGGVADRADFALAAKPMDVEIVRRKVAAAFEASEPGCGRENGPWVAINPGAGWATKRWPPTSFARVIDALYDAGIGAVLIGGKAMSDHLAANEVISLSRIKPAKLTGETSVRELVALLSLASAHLGGDTGSTHIAAALGRPAFGLYSITRPERSCPYGQIERCGYDPVSLARVEPGPMAAKIIETVLGAEEGGGK